MSYLPTDINNLSIPWSSFRIFTWLMVVLFIYGAKHLISKSDELRRAKRYIQIFGAPQAITKERLVRMALTLLETESQLKEMRRNSTEQDALLLAQTRTFLKQEEFFKEMCGIVLEFDPTASDLFFDGHPNWRNYLTNNK